MFYKHIFIIRLGNCFAQKIAIIKAPCRSYCVSTTIRHCYDNIIPFETNKQLADYLCDNILYNRNGVVFLNKPYGICFSREGPQWKREEGKSNRVIQHKLAELPDYNHNYVSAELDKVNLHEALPYIKSNLKCDSLCIIRSPEKYTTGVCVLGRSESIRTKVKKCWERSRAQKVPLESYMTICSGVPINNYINDMRIGITLDVAKSGKTKRAILTKSYSKNNVLESKVKVATVRSSLLSVNADQLASLVEITSSQKKWHFVRLFLASRLLSPALGDHLYGSRVKKVMGTYVKINHWNECASLPQKLSPDLLKLLDLQPGSEKYIPTMIHLSQLNLIGFPNHSRNLTVSAPVPLHFQWTVDKLGLRMPTTALTLKGDKAVEKRISIAS